MFLKLKDILTWVDTCANFPKLTLIHEKWPTLFPKGLMTPLTFAQKILHLGQKVLTLSLCLFQMWFCLCPMCKEDIMTEQEKKKRTSSKLSLQSFIFEAQTWIVFLAASYHSLYSKRNLYNYSCGGRFRSGRFCYSKSMF